MNTIQQIVAVTALALAGSAAMADDITIANDHFAVQKTRAEVRAETRQALARGELPQAGEIGSGAPAVRAGAGPRLTRDQVRAELRNAPKPRAMQFNPAA